MATRELTEPQRAWLAKLQPGVVNRLPIVTYGERSALKALNRRGLVRLSYAGSLSLNVVLTPEGVLARS